MRFPGFTDEWKTRKLGEVAIVSSGGTPNRSTSSYWNGNIPWVSTSLIDFNFIEKVDEYITEEGLTNSSAKLFPKGTLLIAMYGQGKTRGKVAILNIEATTNQACGAITTNNDVLNPLFAFQNLTKRYDEIRDLSNQGGQENLSAGIIKGIKINFPEVQEQQKIVSFIDLIDERISTQNKIIKELLASKATFAKKIFSQEFRFKDNNGNDFSYWEEILLGDVLDYEQPTNYLVTSTEYDNSFETPVVTAGKTFVLGYTNEIKGIFEKEKLPVIIFDDFTTASQFVNFPFKAKSSAMKILKAKNKNNIKFLFEAIQMIAYETGGHGRHWISIFSNLEIMLPSFDEQTKIANFLSSIDSKIEVENQLLQKLKEQKKFLLQQMFV